MREKFTEPAKTNLTPSVYKWLLSHAAEECESEAAILRRALILYKRTVCDKSIKELPASLRALA